VSPAGTPLSLTSFVGRDEELAAVGRLLDTTRLLTLTGAGGSGKTRLAGEVASRCASRFTDGITWVELAPLLDPELLPTYLLTELGAEQGARAPLTAVLDTLRDRKTLLVLDNCEHLVDACAALSDALLRGCPELRILATSREALGVTGERAWLVPGLTLPPSVANAATQPDSIADVAAVRLFVDRAQAALATFQLTPANAGAVAQICRRLDGLPLAIELAAARVRALPPEQLATKLDDAFRVLTSGARTAVPRHRTLREAIDWSYKLLDEPERALLARLSVFSGDFTLQAAEAVGAHGSLEAADVLDTLGALVDKSLVVMREAEGTARFYLLETIRQYAGARLSESGQLPEASAQHARAYINLVAEAAPHLITRERPRWVQCIHRELDNIRVALAFTRDNDAASHLVLAGQLGWFWYSSGLWSEGRRSLEGAIALATTTEANRAARATVLFGAGVLASLQGKPSEAIPWLEECVVLYRAIGNRSGEAYALAYHGVCYGQTGDERTVAPTTQALEWFRAAGDLYGLRLCLVVLSTYHAVRRNVELARELGEEGVAVARAFGLDRELAIALQVLAGVNLAAGDLRRARELYRESLAALRRDMSLFWTARALQWLALAIYRMGDPERATFLMGAAESLRESIGAVLFGHDYEQLTPAMAAAREAMGEATFDAVRKSGRDRPLDEVLEIAVRDTDSMLTVTAPATSQRPAIPEAASTVPLDVRALGSLRIFREGEEMPGGAWRYARPRELLLYLLSHPDGRTRDQIGLVFWPDASPTQVKNNFHVMLHHVRKAIGRSDLITFEKERYRISWHLGVRFDARTFEDLMDPAMRTLRSARKGADVSAAVARVQEALPLYRGDFLGEEEVGDWHLDIRDRLRRLYADGVLLMGDRSLEQGEYREAADAFRRAIQMDALHEVAHRRLMVSLARAGDRSEALRQYERLAHSLQAELEAEPERETKALYEQLKRSEAV
jgi:predicted ATPase/DNA-binding SARP family transcriptional activator